MSNYLGIDLGTLYCKTVLLRDGNTEVIPNRYSTKEIPFMSSVRNNKIIFNSVKQLIDFKTLILPDTRKLSLIDYTAKILNDVHNDVIKFAGCQIDNTILAVPSCFVERQRASLKKAAEQGNFINVNLLDESTALILSMNLPENWNNILVLSLGAGVFNISIFSLRESKLKALWHDGNRHLGGNDFDAAIINYLSESQVLNKPISEYSRHELNLLNNFARDIKHRLSENPKTEITIDAETNSPFIIKNISLTEEIFENIIQDQVKLINGSINKAITEANIKLSDIDQIIFEGGSANIPCIRKLIEAELGANIIFMSGNSIAKGAAWYGFKFYSKLNVEQKGKSEEDSSKEVLEKKHSEVVSPSNDKRWLKLFEPEVNEAQELWRNGNYINSLDKLEHLRKEIKKFINHLYIQLSNSLVNEGRYDQALIIFENRLINDKQNYILAELFEEMCLKNSGHEISKGDFDNARKVLLKGLKIIPNSGRLRKSLKEIKQLNINTKKKL
jgi:actin-like ATPase involved in cell morphogenesis